MLSLLEVMQLLIWGMDAIQLIWSIHSKFEPFTHCNMRQLEDRTPLNIDGSLTPFSFNSFFLVGPDTLANYFSEFYEVYTIILCTWEVHYDKFVMGLWGCYGCIGTGLGTVNCVTGTEIKTKKRKHWKSRIPQHLHP